MLLLGMWKTLTSILGLSQETDTDTDDDDEAEEANPQDFTASSSQSASEEQREFIGVVTSLHSAYGLINHEICFTVETVRGDMPNVGDKVHVVACRKNAVGGWRAKRVWIASDDDFLSEPQTAVPCQLPSISSCTSNAKAALLKSEQDCQELLKDKDGISVTECIDFGNMQLGASSSLSVVIRYSFVHKHIFVTVAACKGLLFYPSE